MLERLIERPDRPFEEYVEADSLMADAGRPDNAALLAVSGLIQFRRLQMLDRALAVEDAQKPAVDVSPLKKAWIASHKDLVVYFEPSGRWFLRPEAFWNLFERNRSAAWADDLAWVAAQHEPGVDECYSACALELIVKGPLQYWKRFPTGLHVVDALKRATELSKEAVDMACYDWDPAHPERGTESPVPHDTIEQISRSLADVSLGSKRDVLGFLDEADRKCRR